MAKKITIALFLTFIGILSIAAAVVWYNNATAQPPWGPEPRGPFPSPETSAICATNDYVYVLSGNILYQFDAADLKLMKKAAIEREPRLGRPGRMEDKFPPSRKAPETEE
ncbi:MAG: hypothetical protein ACE5PV_20005 [Candidatus Poribacteria bacterium]